MKEDVGAVVAREVELTWHEQELCLKVQALEKELGECISRHNTARNELRAVRKALIEEYGLEEYKKKPHLPVRPPPQALLGRVMRRGIY